MIETRPMTKGEIYNLLSPLTKDKIRPEINEVIIKNRNCPEKEAKDVKTLYPKEVEEVLKRFA